MARKKSIVLDDSVLKMLRKKQAELIKKSTHSISLSYVVNKILRENIKKI